MSLLIKKEQLHKTVCYLTQEEIAWMDMVDRDSLFSTGGRIFKTTAIALLLEIPTRLRMRADGIHSSDDFYDRLLRLWNKNPDVVKSGVWE